MATIVVGCTDLIFRAKVGETVKRAGGEASFGRTADDLVKLGGADGVSLVLLDLTVPAFRGIAGRLKEAGAQRVVGFFRHEEIDVRDEALSAGCDEVVTRNEFAKRLPKIIGA